MNSLKALFEVEELAHALEVTPSGFYAHQHKPDRPRRQRDQTLLQKIQPIFKESRQTYGSPRLCASLRKAGERCGKNRSARLMRENGLKARQKHLPNPSWRHLKPNALQRNRTHGIKPGCGSLITSKPFTTQSGSTAPWATNHLWNLKNSSAKH